MRHGNPDISFECYDTSTVTWGQNAAQSLALAVLVSEAD